MTEAEASGAPAASEGGKKGPSRGEKKRLAKQARAEAAAAAGKGQGGGGQQQQQQQEGGKGKKGKKGQKPKMTKEERRAKFLKPKKSNRPGSFKRGHKELCFGCRKPGHRLSECPDKGKDFAGGLAVGERGRICFNCGGDHRLALCPKPKVNGGTSYATCFVCGEQGHLSSQCAQNEKGLYPKGGGCHRCKGTDHLSAHCPLKPAEEEQQQQGGKKDKHAKASKKRKVAEADEEGGGGLGAVASSSSDDEDSGSSGSEGEEGAAPSPVEVKAKGAKAVSAKPPSKPQGGGDDLGDDDFLLEDDLSDAPPQERGEQRAVYGKGRGKWNRGGYGGKGGKGKKGSARGHDDEEAPQRRPRPSAKRPKTVLF